MFYSRGFRTSLIPFLFLILVFSGCRSSQTNSPQQQQQSENEIILPDQTGGAFPVSSDVNLAKPLEISTRPEDVALCDKINQKIEESEFTNARWGVAAVSLKDGRVVCGRDARKLFNPASIQKALTAIVALDTLGADYRWRTSVYSQNQISPDGTLSGDLILYGQGAPDFKSEGLETLVADLQSKGLKHVTGNIVGDDSFFRGTGFGEGWTWNELQWYYGAEASALTFNENQGFINVENGVGKGSTDYMQVATAAPKGSEDNSSNSNTNSKAANGAGVSRGLENNNFYVWGTSKNWGARMAIYNPAGWAARSLKESLQKHGITVDGEAKSANWKSENKLDTTKATEIAYLESQPLGEIIKRMNKHSVNLYAELLLRTIGKRFGDTAPDENKQMQEVRGDDAAGAAVVKKWLSQHNVATDEIKIYDGSGLSRLDFVSPEAFARALIYAAQANFAQAFIDSLPIAATDGTLGGRLGKVKGKVMAKTGTVTFVNSLTGYAQGADETFAFAVIVNNQTRRNDPINVIDSIVIDLVNYGMKNAEGNSNSNQNVSANNKTQKEEKPK